MFDLHILQNQWLILALAGGLAAVGLWALAYLAIWRPRANAAPQDIKPRWSIRDAVPWILILTSVGLMAWAIVYTLMMAANPPNW